jgi:hypothetical protein
MLDFCVLLGSKASMVLFNHPGFVRDGKTEFTQEASERSRPILCTVADGEDFVGIGKESQFYSN